MKSYTTRDVAKLLGLSEAQVRSQAREGYLAPSRGPRNSYRFSFQDLVLLRTAKALSDAHVAPKRIRGALRSLRRQLPSGRSLSGLWIRSEGSRVVVRDGGQPWHPESGQLLLDFPLVEPADVPARRNLASVRMNLGRWLQEDGHPEPAAAEYRAVLASDTRHAAAAFHLGTALEELGRWSDAVAAYRHAVAVDRRLAEAHFNLARLYRRAGKRAAALRHLRAYRALRK
jgi:tetratricopeptide (TPR) repeat protein